MSVTSATGPAGAGGRRLTIGHIIDRHRFTRAIWVQPREASDQGEEELETSSPPSDRGEVSIVEGINLGRWER
jgi:hypothetical protein